MKRKFLSALLFVLITSSLQSRAQSVNSNNLLGKLCGIWTISQRELEVKSTLRTGKLTFLSDGAFESSGIYFGTTKGFYTTDETRSVLVVDIAGKKTEWLASVKKGKLHLISLPESYEYKVVLTLTKNRNL